MPNSKSDAGAPESLVFVHVQVHRAERRQHVDGIREALIVGVPAASAVHSARRDGRGGHDADGDAWNM